MTEFGQGWEIAAIVTDLCGCHILPRLAYFAAVTQCSSKGRVDVAGKPVASGVTAGIFLLSALVVFTGAGLVVGWAIGLPVAGGAVGAVVGGPNVTQRNVVSGNGASGVRSSGVLPQILNNIIGGDASGQSDVGNDENGISLSGAGSIVGPDLSDVGATRSAGSLQRSLLDPGSQMMPINRPVRLVKKDGTTVYVKDYLVQATKEGQSLGAKEKKNECVVSGGLGTMKVMHKGETYYVCCSGCRDAFNDDPEKFIKEAAAKKKN